MVDLLPLTGVAMVALVGVAAGFLARSRSLSRCLSLSDRESEPAESVPFTALEDWPEAEEELSTLFFGVSGVCASCAFDMIVVPSALHTAVCPDFLSPCVRGRILIATLMFSSISLSLSLSRTLLLHSLFL
mmetsp:Transcript_22256/g.87664  ORF Transcript_22256/g.87664 Transcript_22256/m.87664 type:complete len:131 (-) Transcript_22256:2094-2486(-)